MLTVYTAGWNFGCYIWGWNKRLVGTKFVVEVLLFVIVVGSSAQVLVSMRDSKCLMCFFCIFWLEVIYLLSLYAVLIHFNFVHFTLLL